MTYKVSDGVKSMYHVVNTESALKPCTKTNCKECRHCDVKVSKTTGRDIYYAFECKKYGTLSNSVAELQKSVNKYVEFEND